MTFAGVCVSVCSADVFFDLTLTQRLHDTLSRGGRGVVGGGSGGGAGGGGGGSVSGVASVGCYVIVGWAWCLNSGKSWVSMGNGYTRVRYS